MKKEYHYFASSFAEWHVGTDLVALLNFMNKRKKKDGFQFAVWLVPNHERTPYKIRNFVPQVTGAVPIYESEEGIVYKMGEAIEVDEKKGGDE